MSEIVIAADAVTLCGTVWEPAGGPKTPGLALIGGSGPTDRSNGGYFDALREHLVDAGMTVLAWDKRGAGASTGSWAAAGAEALATDAAAAVAALRCHPGVDARRIAMFGHSEGGWVTLRACADGVGVRGVILNSCPAVSFIEAEVYALAREGVPADVSRGLFERLRAAAQDGCDSVTARRIFADALDPTLIAALARSGFALTEERWDQLRAWIDYDPSHDLGRLDVPALAIYGSEDPLVPVTLSERILRDTAPSVDCRIFAGADHRVLVGGRPAAGYFELVTAWCRSHL